MATISDEELARILQAEFDEEYQEVHENDGSKNQRINEVSDYSAITGPPALKDTSSRAEPLSLIDAQWELLDPTPDPRALFVQFNDKYFWGQLAGVEVRWSPRMTLCAGVCSYEGRGGLCSIRLSVPLLKLRPRKDLVETLLHEMIHAYLFVTQNNRDRDGHGPEFCKHMYRINKESGTKITIYHSFHDEVDNYRQHWWRCDGPCQKRKPFFGYVKRAMNRAPSAHDNWWASHQQTCGGTFTKIKEPEGYSNKKRKKEENETDGTDSEEKKHKKNGSQDIRNFLPFSGTGHRLGGSTTSVPPGVAGPSRSRLLAGGSDLKENKNLKMVTHSDKISVPYTNGLTKADGQKDVKNNVLVERREINVKTDGVVTKHKDVHDCEKKQKKLNELKAIFLSSSEDEEEDGVETDTFKKQLEKKRKPELGTKLPVDSRNEKQGCDISQTSCKEDTSSSDSTGKFHSNNRLGINSKPVKTLSGSNEVNKNKTRVLERREPTENVARGENLPGQGSLHHLVDRMKRKSGEGGDYSRVGVKRLHSTEPAEPRTRNVNCPVCGKEELDTNINSHLDVCLSG